MAPYSPLNIDSAPFALRLSNPNTASWANQLESLMRPCALSTSSAAIIAAVLAFIFFAIFFAIGWRRAGAAIAQDEESMISVESTERQTLVSDADTFPREKNPLN